MVVLQILPDSIDRPTARAAVIDHQHVHAASRGSFSVTQLLLDREDQVLCCTGQLLYYTKGTVGR